MRGFHIALCDSPFLHKRSLIFGGIAGTDTRRRKCDRMQDECVL